MPGASPGAWRLAVTERCLADDLGLPASVEWGAYADHIPILAAFRDRRGQAPEGAEVIQQVLRVPGGVPVFALHSEHDRAGTWYDEEEQIVWLVGIGRGHDYDHLEQLARQGRLYPTEDDYRPLDARVPDAFELEGIARDARRLRQQAMAAPGRVVVGTLGTWLGVRICLEPGDPGILTVALSQSISEDAHLPHSWEYLVAQAFYPDAEYPDDFVPFALSICGDDVKAHELGLAYFVGETV